MKIKLNTFLIFIYFLVGAAVFLSFKASLLIWISFFINFSLISLIFFYHLKIEKKFSPFLTSLIVFAYLFLIIAPIIQISSFNSSTDSFITNYPYIISDVIYTNFLILIFFLTFIISYIILTKKIIPYELKSLNIATKPLLIVSLSLITFVIIFIHYDSVILDITSSTYEMPVQQISVAANLIKTKVIFMIPFGGIIHVYGYLREPSKNLNNKYIIIVLLFLLIACLLFLKNPFNEKRNLLGPVYITLFFLVYPKLLNRNSTFFLFMFVSLVVLFPIFSTFTHIDANLSEIITNPGEIVKSYNRFGGITTAFQKLHYDAFSNIMATVDYTTKNGFSYGYQLLSALLFFVPRSLWSNKPISTGELIGNHLIDDYGFGYNNLSNCIVSEAYIDYGIFGVVLFGFVLAYFFYFFLKWLQSNDFAKSITAFYFSTHLIFLLRGDLTNGFAYFIGVFIGIYTIPKLLERIIFYSVKKTR